MSIDEVKLNEDIDKIPTTSKLHASWQRTADSVPMPARTVYDPSRAIYPSEIGQCERKATLRLLKYQAEPFSKAASEAMTGGLVAEDYIALLWAYEQIGLGEDGSRIIRNQPVMSPYGRGKIDIYLPDIPHIIEVKSTGSNSAPYLPQQAHKDQLLWYLKFFGIEHGVTEGELTYFLRDTRECISFNIPYDELRVEALIDWANTVSGAVKSRKPLEKPSGYQAHKSPCSFGNSGKCQFFNHCWETPETDSSEGELLF